MVLSVRDLALDGVFKGVSFDLRQGEILGIAGLIGAGRTNVAETIFGVTPARRVKSGSTASRSRSVPEDRHGPWSGAADRGPQGQRLFLMLGAGKHADRRVRTHYRRAASSAERQLAALCTELRDTLRIKTPTLNETIGNLSGGNQQKALIARWLMTNPRILILDEPTRGIDVGAKAEIHRLISDLAGQGSRDHHDFVGDAGNSRHERPHHGHARGPCQRLPRPCRGDQEKIMDLAAR